MTDRLEIASRMAMGILASGHVGRAPEEVAADALNYADALMEIVEPSISAPVVQDNEKECEWTIRGDGEIGVSFSVQCLRERHGDVPFIHSEEKDRHGPVYLPSECPHCYRKIKVARRAEK